jgi:phosphoglycerate dehydrogenase-like enzyme
MALTIWCNAQLTDTATQLLIDGTRDHRLIFGEQISNLSKAAPDSRVAEADVAFGQPDPEQMITHSNIRWMHITSAGYTRYDRNDLRDAFQARGAAFTNSSSVYDEPCAQHVLAFMLSSARQLPASVAAQLDDHSWIYARLRPLTRVLKGDTVLILGYGAIAKRLVELLEPFGLKIIALRQHIRGDEAVETHAASEAAKFFPLADHIVNTLPASPSTEGWVSRELLGTVKASAVFYNIGRGNTVDQAALVECLNAGRLGGAYLDVTDPEPLPADHSLWSARNCVITPHIGGGFEREYEALVEHFLGNLGRFETGLLLRDRVV